MSALRWQLYVTAYTQLFGLPLLTAPNQVLPILGFDATEQPWVRLAGMFLLSLSFISFGIYRRRATALIVYSIAVRAFITCVLLALAANGHPPFLYVMAAIVGTGVAGSLVAMVADHRRAGGA